MSVDFVIDSRIDDIVASGDLALVRGVNAVKATPAGPDTGNCVRSKYLMSLKKTDAGWQIAQLMWSMTFRHASCAAA